MPRSLHLALLSLLALFAAPLAGADAGVTRRAFSEVVENDLRPQVERLLQRLVREGKGMQIDGMQVFNGSDKFLAGKIALAFSDLILSLPAADPRRAQYLQGFGAVAKLIVDEPNDSWGIYYYLSSLYALRSAGIALPLDPLTLAKLRVRLDWRTFVDTETFTLIDHPNNYYCVAFAIARLRHKLGWEDASGAGKLYEALTAHYLEYSGAYGFADETDGEGRFDRYSVLLAGEIAQRFMETGEKPPQQVIDWLRKSADVMMMRLNAQGAGFEYGRSLGPYSETAIIEVLTVAAAVGILDDAQKLLAYTYASRAAERYADFWLDPHTDSLNLWGEGRRTDDYRGKFRILGENLSLAHQYFYTDAWWNRLGFHNCPPLANFEAALANLPVRGVTWFARGTYDRALLTLRDGGWVIGLPLINGGKSQHMHSPYFPIPFANGLLSGVPDGEEPLLLPRFELADGTVLMPLAYMRDIDVREEGRRTVVSYRQSELDRMGRDAPVADDRIALSTTYVFEPGSITRTDVYTPKRSVAIRSVALAFASYSLAPATSGTTTKFASGAVREFSVTGLDQCAAAAVANDPRFQTSTGPFASRVTCRRGSLLLQRALVISWRLRYEPVGDGSPGRIRSHSSPIYEGLPGQKGRRRS